MGLDMHDLDSVKLNIKNDRYDYNGHSVPRVTEILAKTIHEDGIVYWANSLGFKRKGYRTTLSMYAEYGTKVHSAIESIINEEEISDDTPFIPIEAFKTWWNEINSNNSIRILGQEFKLSCPWFGGTYDMLLEINRKNYLIDFKTSNRITYKYCLQLAAYNYMLKFNNLYPISGAIVLQLCKEAPDYNELFINLEDPDHKNYFDFCEQTFLSLVYSYYHIQYAEANFKILEAKK